MIVRLLFISVDVWYRRLSNNTAVLTVLTNIVSLLTTADKHRLITINRDRTRPYMRHTCIQYKHYLGQMKFLGHI